MKEGKNKTARTGRQEQDGKGKTAMERRIVNPAPSSGPSLRDDIQVTRGPQGR